MIKYYKERSGLMTIAIDGMSASGKSTLAFMLAQKLSLKYLNSGSIYRCIALKVMKKEININDDQLEETILNLNIDFKIVNNKQCVFLDNIDVTDKIRLEEVSVFTPSIANNHIIKPAIRKIQQRFVDAGNVVIEGRDIGTRIIPNADYKFYLYSSLEKRAERLYNELKDKQDITYDEIYNDLKNRDEKDIKDGNFIKPKNSIEIDTTNLSLEEVLNIMLSYINIKEK